MSQLRDDVEYTSSWVREPQGRGTLSILYTCTFTLILCVYTAVHLNIPPAGEPRRWQILRKIKWMFISIFAPEVVLFTAAYQYWNARKFCQEMESIRAEQGGGAAVKKRAWWRKVMSIAKEGPGESMASAEANSLQPPEPFSMTYGFYVVMGGLTVDVSDMHNSHKTLTLSPFGVTHMARLSSWKHFAVSDTTIDDKSKADTLAKSLVILQVSWLFLQCVARASQGRPLTILEVHTLVHAACAMLMYGLWFKKPLDIRDATVVDSSEFADDLAMELLDMPITPDLANTPSNTSGLRVFPSPSALLSDPRSSSKPPRLSEYEAMVFHREQTDDDQGEGGQDARDYQIVTPGTESGEVICTLHPGQILPCGVGPGFGANKYVKWQIESWSLTAKDLLRWNRAARARPKPTYRPSVTMTDPMGPPYRGDSTLPMDTVISTRSDNFQEGLADGYIGKIDTELVSLVGLCLTMSGYGAIHLALWNFAFPSHAEMLLWKVSACTMVSPLGLGFAVFSVVGILNLLEKWELDELLDIPAVVDVIIVRALQGFVALFILLFGFARVFIVVESFLSLRMVPVGVYEGITWADYIPHL